MNLFFFFNFHLDFLLGVSLSSINYVSIASRVSFLQQGFWYIGKTKPNQTHVSFQLVQQAPKLNGEILFSEQVAGQPRIIQAKYLPSEDREVVLQYLAQFSKAVFLFYGIAETLAGNVGIQTNLPVLLAPDAAFLLLLRGISWLKCPPCF